jgi:hypothetical protein
MNFRRTARLALTASTIFFLAACAPKPDPRIVNFEAEGSRLILTQLTCVDLSAVAPIHTPAEILPGVAACMNKQDYERAARLYGLAGLYGRIDVLRVTDRTARRAIAELISKELEQFPQDELDRVQEAIVEIAEDRSDMRDMCDEIRAVGPPQYYPAYMIDRGTDAAVDDASSLEPVDPNFDMDKAWKESLKAFLKCT